MTLERRWVTVLCMDRDVMDGFTYRGIVFEIAW